MKHNTNWNKTFADPSEYKSNWDWTVAHSEYHFDDSIQDQEGDWFKILGRFENPASWAEEVERLTKLAVPVNWETRKFYGDRPEVSPMIQQEEYDVAQGGGDPKGLKLASMLDEFEEYPTLKAICDYFGLESDTDPSNDVIKKYRAHMQLTGQMFNRHIDKLWDWCPSDPERICRIAIFLEDWQPGQFYMYGNYVYSGWKAGESHVFDWPNVPHCTANASNHVRPSLLITGLKSDRTREIIKNGSIDTVFKLNGQ